MHDRSAFYQTRAPVAREMNLTALDAFDTTAAFDEADAVENFCAAPFYYPQFDKILCIARKNDKPANITVQFNSYHYLFI